MAATTPIINGQGPLINEDDDRLLDLESDTDIEEQTAGDDQPLLQTDINSTAAGEPGGGQSVITVPKRKIIIEPIMVLFFLAYSFEGPIKTLFVYAKLKEEHSYLYANLSEPGAKFDNGTGCPSTNKSDPWYQADETIQRLSANFNFISSMIYSVPAIFLTIYFGALVDHTGRKFGLLLPSAMAFLRNILYIVIIYFNLPVYWLYVNSVLEALGGGGHLLTISSNAYMADVIPAEKRTFRLVVLDVPAMLCSALVQVAVGWWIKTSGFLPPYLVGGSLFLVNLLYIIFFVPEIRQITVTCSTVFEWRYCVQIFKVLLRKRKSKRHIKIFMMLAICFVFGLSSSYEIRTLFLMNPPLCWDSVKLGYYSAVSMIAMSIGSTIMVRLLVGCKVSDPSMIFMSGLIYCADYIFRAFIRTTAMAFISPTIGMWAPGERGIMRSMLSKIVEPDERASIFALYAVVESAISLFSGSLYTNVYSATLEMFAGFPFFISAFCYLLGAVLIRVYIHVTRKIDRQQNAQLKRQSSVNDQTCARLDENFSATENEVRHRGLGEKNTD